MTWSKFRKALAYQLMALGLVVGLSGCGVSIKVVGPHMGVGPATSATAATIGGPFELLPERDERPSGGIFPPLGRLSVVGSPSLACQATPNLSAHFISRSY